MLTRLRKILIGGRILLRKEFNSLLKNAFTYYIWKLFGDVLVAVSGGAICSCPTINLQPKAVELPKNHI